MIVDYNDVLGNPGNSAISPNYTMDTLLPTIVVSVIGVPQFTMSNTLLRLNDNGTSQTSRIEITFSETVNFINSHITIPNVNGNPCGTLSTVTYDSGNNYWYSIFTPRKWY